jgi:DNA mismatch repair ATPase MutS
MAFQGILSIEPAGVQEACETPEFFRDLNLDQIVERIVRGAYGEYDLSPFFLEPLDDLGTIIYRQEVARDIEREDVLTCIKTFSESMRAVRVRLDGASKARCPLEGQRWFLGAVETYVQTVKSFAARLSALELTSRGLCGWRDWLRDYAASAHFQELDAKTTRLGTDLAAIRYCVHIDGTDVNVREYHDEADYTSLVETTFGKFWRRSQTSYLVPGRNSEHGLNRVEVQILERVARLNPVVFAELNSFCIARADFLDTTLARFNREVQFYVAYLEYIRRIRQVGLPFCYPTLWRDDKTVESRNGFDLALAHKLAEHHKHVVCNDFALSGAERILVVSGPNHGGKTTFARTFGQLHYLARLGLPVPGDVARLFLCDHIFTHFERVEDIADLRGKLHADLVRIRRILDEATPRSIVVLNEIFASTTLKDAVFLTKKIMARLSALDALAVCVTFLSELSTYDEKTVSLLAVVKPDDPAMRTFKVERRPADGMAYALVVAAKHGVTYEQLKERIAS